MFCLLPFFPTAVPVDPVDSVDGPPLAGTFGFALLLALFENVGGLLVVEETADPRPTAAVGGRVVAEGVAGDGATARDDEVDAAAGAAVFAVRAAPEVVPPPQKSSAAAFW